MSITDRAHLPAGLEPGKAGPIPATTGSVSVFDDRTCNATTTSGCGDVRTLQLPGGNGLAVTVDPATDTVYVTTAPASGPDTVSVFNGATCNATHSRRLRPDTTVGDGRIRRRIARRQYLDRHRLRRQPRSE